MEDCLDGHTKYVAVLTPDEWKKDQENFRMGIEMEIERHPHTTKAEVNYDSLTGSFSIPSRHDLTGRDHEFAFALDENGKAMPGISFSASPAGRNGMSRPWSVFCMISWRV